MRSRLKKRNKKPPSFNRSNISPCSPYTSTPVRHQGLHPMNHLSTGCLSIASCRHQVRVIHKGKTKQGAYLSCYCSNDCSTMPASFAIFEDDTTDQAPERRSHSVSLTDSRYRILWILTPIYRLRKAKTSFDTVSSLL